MHVLEVMQQRRPVITTAMFGGNAAPHLVAVAGAGEIGYEGQVRRISSFRRETRCELLGDLLERTSAL